MEKACLKKIIMLFIYSRDSHESTLQLSDMHWYDILNIWYDIQIVKQHGLALDPVQAVSIS